MLEPLEAEKNAFLSHFPVPRGTLDKLCCYVDLLCEWNERINLVADSSIPHVWSRHILDSAQLMNFIPSTAHSLVDMGSGAGFPGLVLAIMGAPLVHLIESVGKKANFLRTVVEDLRLNVTIHQERIESIKGLRCDVVTARALKALPELLGLAKHLTHKNSTCLFLKGHQTDAELTEALKYWTFTYDKTPSLSDTTGTVLKITDLKALNLHGVSHAHKRST